jgi:hypothetical protein
MSIASSSIKPAVLRVKAARQYLGGMGHKKFWQEAARGEFEILGNPKLRLVTTRSLDAYIERQPRAPYSRKLEGNAAA